MKRLGKFATVGVSLTITAILLGCGTSGKEKVAPAHHVSNTTNSSLSTPSITESNTTNSTVQTASSSSAPSSSNASTSTNTDSTTVATTADNGLNGNNSASTISNSAATVIIESIQPQPSGLLIQLDKQATSAVKQIVHSPRYSNTSLSFTLQDVRVSNPSIAKLNETVGNQLIQNLKVQNHGTDLIVSMTLMQPVNKINLGTSGSYLGIALQDEPSQPMPQPHPVGRIPSWFFKDMLIAASTQGTPVRADTYGGMLPFESTDKTYMLRAPFSGSQETLGFNGYFGNIPLYGDYINILNASSNGSAGLYSQVQYGVIREGKSGEWYGVNAIMVNMQNGWQLGFAKNQLIVENNHAGALTYIVYPVQGVELGAPLQQ